MNDNNKNQQIENVTNEEKTYLQTESDIEKEHLSENQLNDESTVKKILSNKFSKVGIVLIILAVVVGGSLKAIEEYREYKAEKSHNVSSSLFDDDDDDFDDIKQNETINDNKNISVNLNEQESADFEKIKDMLADNLNVQKEKIKFTKFNIDYTDDYSKYDKTNKKIYEVELITSNTKYEFDIDADNLSILKKEID